MKRLPAILTVVAVWVFGVNPLLAPHVSILIAQEPLPVPKVNSRVVPEKMTCKPGKLYKLPGASKGEVKFDFDPKALEAIVDGKTLTFVGPTQNVKVLVASSDPFELQACLIEVEGMIPFPPDEATDAKLRRDMNAGFARIDKVLAEHSARLAVLERQPPVDPKPKPPVPTTVVKHLSFVGVTKSSEASVVNDASLRAWLKINGVAVHIADASFGPFAATVKLCGTPCVILQDAAGNIIDAEHMTSVERIKLLVSKYLPNASVPESRSGPAMPSGLTIEERVRWWEQNYPEFASKP